MASACHCILFLFLLVAGYLCDATDENILDFEMARKHELWMAKHGRVYNDEAEKARRFEIYKKNMKYIEDFNNAGGHNYTLGEGPFTDLTREEFLATYTSPKLPKPEVEESHRSFKYETTDSQNYTDLPSSFDWSAYGAVSSVKHQGYTCGSCWAFTTAAVIESLTKIKKGVLYDLSPQQLVDCDSSNGGCHGGSMVLAYNYVIGNGGLTTFANYPYTEVKGTCDKVKERQAVATIDGFRYVPSYSEKELMKAVTRQPIAVAVEASDDFQHYKNGVFHGYCETSLNHAVTLVGYGEEDPSNKYWLIKNSWGTKWGEGGYIRLEKDVRSPSGLCGITKHATYPTLNP